MRSSHLLVSLLFCFLIVFSLFTAPASSQGSARSLLLNGSSQAVTAPSSSSLNVTGSITVEAWIKLNSNGTHQVILSREAFQQAGTGGGYRLTISNTGKLRFDLFQSPTAYVTVTGATTVSTATWHHVAGVFDGNQMRVFLDGVMDGSLSTTSGPAAGTGLFYIGRRSDVYVPYYFGGAIDDVRVSGAALYANNFTPGLGSSSSIRGLWKFDGQTVNDFSANGNNGTAQGGAGYSTDVPPASNAAPSVTLTAPLNNTSFAAGSNVVLDATASDPDGSVSKVDFYQGATLLGTDTSAPYTFVWTNVPAGIYSLTAKATDDASASTTSSAIAITVIAAGGNHSLSLNGTTASVDVPNSSSLNITGPITIEAWIKFNAIDGNYHDIVSRINRNDSSSGGGYSLTINNLGKLRLDLFQAYNAYTTVISATVLSTNAWHHVAGVFDGNQIRVYVDGVLDASVNTTNGPGSGTSLLRIGKAAHNAGAPPLYLPSFAFAGLIDDVRVSAAALYSSNFTPGLGPGSNVRGLWKFDAQSTNDFSGAGNDATLAGGATYSSDGPPAGSGASQRPVPVAGGPYSVQVGLPVQLFSTGSFDPDGAISSYHWNFGDGTAPSNAVNPTHSYSAPGLYSVTLTAIDNSGLLASATAPVTITGTANARLDPMNETGGGDENPLSQNYNWTLPLVSLPGRAAMGLDLALSYNSLVWTRNGTYVSFDDDRGFPGPGFRLGFPVIQPIYYNPETARYAFLLIGSDGSRVELRQVGTSTLYEAADSSHLLLDASTMILRTTDGTQLKYELKGSDYNCTELKDRNGNHVSVNYTSFGRVDNVVDTLGRVVRFNYDSNGWLTSITQTWNQGSPNQVTHNWATFTYTNTTIQTNFSGLSVSGPSNGSTIKTLAKVTLADNSHYDFSWTSWGQVWKISNFAADNHLLNYRSYNLPLTANTSQSEAPRFTERRDWAENWNENSSGIEQEAVTAYAPPAADSWTMPDGTQQTGIRAQVTAPDLTVDKIYFIGSPQTSSGWRRGLPILINTYSNGALQRQIVKTWSQDNTSVSYPLNPRVVETNTYDPFGNRARVQISYQQITFANGTSCSLPRDVLEFDANATSVLRSSRTTYNTSTAFTDRRIIGLVSERQLYQGDVNSGGVLMSKVALFYDGSAIQGTDAPIQHDNTNYGANLVTGRANLTSVRRHDVTNTAQFTTTTSKYNTTGAIVSATDASNHSVQLSYSDSFSDGNNSRNTLAYPTSVTDPDGYVSITRYNFDFGAITYKRTPQPNTTQNLPGPEQLFLYDQIARLQQVTNPVDGAYKRYEYAPSQTRVDTFSSVQEGLNEAHSLEVTDGAGRVIARAASHPGSIGGFSGQKFVYNVRGRLVKASNPTETNASGPPSLWAAAGDDAGTGWLYTEQSYDWKGRLLVTKNQDGTTKTASYAGCGCAGGEVVTLIDEGTLEAGINKRRQQKIYSDVIGRTVKTEIFNWQGGSIYSTTVNTFNARDQVTQVREYAGAEGSGTYQDTTLTYDGYGRLKTKHVPEQNPGANTIWTYNADDTVNTTTDGRGAVTSVSYNARHLPTSVTHFLAGQPNVTASFSYDAARNRTTMTDSLGTTSYGYDQLSRLVSETRGFTGVGNYTIGYQYNRHNDLISLTGPTNTTVSYTRDHAGRLTAVSRPGQALASAISYRASGAMKHMVYGDNSTMDVTFNSRLQAATYNLPGKISKTYSYHDDGTLQFSSDGIDHRFDRSYGFDQAGRLKSALSGAEARGEGTTTNRPYNQTYSYDVFGHLDQRTGKTWGTSDYILSQLYLNNRRVGWQYDADGRLVDGDDHYAHDAAGRNNYLETSSLTTATMGYDGDGRQVKTIETWVDANLQTQSETKYYVRSTVLGGQVLAELDSSAAISRTFVFAGPVVLGWISHTESLDPMIWEQRDPNNASVRGIGERELDPLGADAGTSANSVPPSERALVSFGESYNPAHPNFSYSVDGIRVPVEDFVHHAGFILKDPLGLLDWLARKTAVPIGYRFSGAMGGRRFEVITDVNRKIQSQSWGGYDAALDDVDHFGRTPIFGKMKFDPALLPQRSGFNLQGPGFTADQMAILANTFRRINQEDCRSFINETLAKHKVKKEFNSLEKLLDKSTLGSYDEDSDYTNQDLGVDYDGTIFLLDAFANKNASAATVQNHIFLSSKVFDRSQNPLNRRTADTASYIVHELLHVAGIDKSIVDSQEMMKEIRDHCRLTGSDSINLSH